jgi:hypothetical protein
LQVFTPLKPAIAITPISGHWRFEETNQESLEWIKKQLEK